MYIHLKYFSPPFRFAVEVENTFAAVIRSFVMGEIYDQLILFHQSKFDIFIDEMELAEALIWLIIRWPVVWFSSSFRFFFNGFSKLWIVLASIYLHPIILPSNKAEAVLKPFNWSGNWMIPPWQAGHVALGHVYIVAFSDYTLSVFSSNFSIKHFIN